MLYKHSTVVKKKRRGQYFTHPVIAREIVREICDSIVSERFWKPWNRIETGNDATNHSNIVQLIEEVLKLQFVDPAMGDGVFLIEVVRYFERFLRELWKKTCSKPYLDLLNDYFQNKLAMNFPLVGKGDILTLDIWKLHIIRSMIYGVDLDPKVVDLARNNITSEFCNTKIISMARIFTQLNLKVGNSLFSPLRMKNENREDLRSQFHSDIDLILSQRKKIQECCWNAFSDLDLDSMLMESETQKHKIADQLYTQVASVPEFSFLLKQENPEVNPFMWELEFPEVFFPDKSGFDAVIGNPPWDKWKLYDREWLGSTAIGKIDYAQQISDIQRNDAESHSDYLRLKEFYKTTTEYFNKFFQWQPGEKNLFKLFLERFYDLCCFSTGFLGIILPGGLLGEYYSQPLREMLLRQMQILYMIEIISNQEMFPDAEPGLSILIILAQKSNTGESFPFIKGVTSIEAFTNIFKEDYKNQSDNLIYFAQEDILRFSPRSIIPAIRNQLELRIIRKMTKFPSLSSAKWGCVTSRGIDMTNDRDLLVKFETQFPLIEGRHLVRLGFDDTTPRYWIRSFEEYKRKIPFWNQTIIVWKNFSGNHRRRRMRIAILPPGAVISNSVICLYNFPSIPEVHHYLAGIMCSIPFEFRIRQLCYGININQFVIDSITVPFFDPSQDIHRKLAVIVKQFLPRGKEWAKRKMEACSSVSKARLEADYQHTITKIDSLAASIYKLTRSEFEATLSAHPQLEDSYINQALDHFDVESP